MAKNSFQIIHKRKGMKNLIRKVVWMQAYVATSGIQKNEGRQWVQGGSGKKKIKLAKLAQTLETYATWIQSKTAVITTFLGTTITIPAGARLTRPARPFIMLYKLPEIWNKIKESYRATVLQHFASNSRNYKQGAKAILDELGEKCKTEQKNRILSLESTSNSPITQAIKGFDFPLMHKGRLESSIRCKTIPTSSGRANAQMSKLKYINQIDELIRQLNGK